MCAVCFFGCGVSALGNGPRANDVVYGNGGFSVVKGDYLYFSNAYCDYNSLKDGENKYDFNSSKKVYGIYRVKLNEDKLVRLDSDGFPIGAELMVPQVGAYAYSGLYICGDYLYYTTPFTGNKSGTYVKGLISFERVNLNRTGHKVLMKMEDYSSSCKYYINYINGVTYITILDTNSNVILMSVKGENVETKTVAYDVSGMVCEHSEITNVGQEYIYYTVKEGNYYSLFKKSMVNSSETKQVLISSTTNELELVKFKNGRLYYKEGKVLKSSNFENNAEPKVYTNQEISSDDENGLKSFYILDDTNGVRIDRGVAFVSYDGSNYSVNIYNGSSSEFLFSDSKQINILHIYNNCVYYKLADDESLYCYNIVNDSSSKVCENFVTSVDDENTGVYDFDDCHGFYFNTVEEANNSLKYLHMVNLNGFGYEDDDNNNIGHFIGVLDARNIY